MAPSSSVVVGQHLVAHLKFADFRIVENQSTAEAIDQQAAHGGAEGCGYREAAAASYGTAP